jgi:predicted component of type VI protein secretion system
MALKDKKKKKKPRPRRLGTRPFVPVFKTGMNRDIPMGGAGGSQNLLANLQASRQAQPSAQVIQTPDQFKLAQDIKAIRTEQADIAEEVAIQKKERKERSDKGIKRAPYKKQGITTEQAEAAATEMLKTTSNLRRQHGADPREEEVAAAAGAAEEMAHTEAGNVVPPEMKKSKLRIVPDSFGGEKRGATGTRAE